MEPYFTMILLLYNNNNNNKSEELITVVWYPNRWWDWGLSEDEKRVVKVCVGSMQFEGIGAFLHLI